jgi:hypothetical protein
MEIRAEKLEDDECRLATVKSDRSMPNLGLFCNRATGLIDYLM